MAHTIRPLSKDEVTFHLACLDEDTPVRGNALESGDPDVDKRAEDRILADLECNAWAWCCVQVRATWRGFSGEAYLGCCSYTSEDDFRGDAYYLDLCNEALHELNTTLAIAAELIV